MIHHAPKHTHTLNSGSPDTSSILTSTYSLKKKKEKNITIIIIIIKKYFVAPQISILWTLLNLIKPNIQIFPQKSGGGGGGWWGGKSLRKKKYGDSLTLLFN